MNVWLNLLNFREVDQLRLIELDQKNQCVLTATDDCQTTSLDPRLQLPFYIKMGSRLTTLFKW